MKQTYYLLALSAVLCSLVNSYTMQDLGHEDVSPQLRDVATPVSVQPLALPAAGQNKVAYSVFDVTPAGQGILPMPTFTDNANVVVVFEGTLWELADTVHCW